MIEASIGFAAVLALVLLRMPIAFAMGLVGMLGYAHLNSFRGAISMVGRLVIDTAQNYGLSVVPLFILMGLFVNKGGLSRELYQVSFAFLGHLRGGLAMATIVACAGFAAICWIIARHRCHHVKGGHAGDAQVRVCLTVCAPASIAAGGTLGHPHSALCYPRHLWAADGNLDREAVHCRHYPGTGRSSCFTWAL